MTEAGYLVRADRRNERNDRRIAGSFRFPAGRPGLGSSLVSNRSGDALRIAKLLRYDEGASSGRTAVKTLGGFWLNPGYDGRVDERDVQALRLGDRWTHIRAVVARWRSLKDDWDGDDAVAPTSAQMRAVDSFIGAAAENGVREPRSYIGRDGEVGFHWDGRRKATVSFLAEGRFLAFCPRPDAEPLRMAGPLDIAACSQEMFAALAAFR